MKTCSARNPGRVASFEEPYSAESADWKGGDPAAVSDKDRKRLAGWAVKNEIILEAERRLYILLFTKVVCQDDLQFA